MDSLGGLLILSGVIGLFFVAILSAERAAPTAIDKYTHLCKQTKEHPQTNMIVMECIKNE